MEAIKTVIIVDSTLPLGILGNAIAYLAATLGQRIEPRLRPDVRDGNGRVYVGMAEVILPILQASRETMQEMYAAGLSSEDLVVIGFSQVAQTSATYEMYTAKLAQLAADEVYFLGLAVYGPKKAVNRLTGNLPLLREHRSLSGEND